MPFEKPVTLGDEPEAIHEKRVPGMVAESEIAVVDPVQRESSRGVLVIPGTGFTITG